jgi:hypothetical protein
MRGIGYRNLGQETGHKRDSGGVFYPELSGNCTLSLEAGLVPRKSI